MENNPLAVWDSNYKHWCLYLSLFIAITLGKCLFNEITYSPIRYYIDVHSKRSSVLSVVLGSLFDVIVSS